MAFNIPNLTGLAADQQLFATESRIAESTRRGTELLADRAGANFLGLAPQNFFVPLGAEFGNLNAPQSFDFGGFAPIGGAAFPAPALFDTASSAQLFSQQMLGSFGQLAGGWESLLGGGGFGAGLGLAGFGSPGAFSGSPSALGGFPAPPRCL